jgi:hypothetical protein
LKKQKNAVGFEVKNEKEDVASLGVAFSCRFRRMRDDSRHGRRYSESRESREKGSLRVERGSGVALPYFSEAISMTKGISRRS